MTDPARLPESSGHRVLAIESSCDETAAAVVEGLTVRSSVIASQIKVHAEFGGVVPELASRHHLDAIVPVIRAALRDADVELGQLDALAVTDSPGLVGALLVGVMAARGLSLSAGLPLLGIHHLEGHLVSPFLGDDERAARSFVPHMALVVSGGHTELVAVEAFGRYTKLGSTRDDAVGEAYDKVSKMLGTGYPGGPVIDRLARSGDPEAIAFPRAMISKGLEFSFSGLKTAVAVHLEKKGMPTSRGALEDLCASFQAAVVEVLVRKTVRAVQEVGASQVRVVGGVAANSGLRSAMTDAGTKYGFAFEAVPLQYCGDNAAMIAGAASLRLAHGMNSPVNVRSTLSLDALSEELAQ
jgi:N6-L-threonylcarbamoyladenine synthase